MQKDQAPGPPFSATLAINEEVRRRLDAGQRIVHLGFGEAGIPVHPLLRTALAGAAGEGSYGPVQGDPRLRAAVAGAYGRRGLETNGDQIIVGPGSKALLFALMLALDGDLVLPQPSWVTYAAQADLAGKRVVRVPIPAAAGGVPDPDRLVAAVTAARREGLDPRILLITNPDNPTGTLAPPTVLAATVAAARELALTTISDEIYADLVHEPATFVSAATVDPDCILTGGLSKSLALGGWRVGALRLPDSPEGGALRSRLISIASEIWSALPSPIAVAARLAYEEPPELVAHVAAGVRLHAQVAESLHGALVGAGASCRAPQAAFYLYPDLEALRKPIGERGIHDGDSLASVLLDEYGVAVLPGSAFGDNTRELRFRVASSLLYGHNDAERWDALRAAASGSAGRLPNVVEAAARLRDAVEALTS